MSNKNLTYGLIVVGIIAIIALFTPAGKAILNSFGATSFCATSQTTCLPSLELTGNQLTTIPSLQIDSGSLTVGTSGSNITQIIKGSCALTVVSTQVASSSAPYDCAVTGVQSGDIVIMQFATTTGSPLWGKSGLWNIVAAQASTTNGFVTAVVQNQTGGTNVLSQTGIASTTNYTIIR